MYYTCPKCKEEISVGFSSVTPECKCTSSKAQADEIKRLREALEEIKAKEWELAGEQTPSYLIAHFVLEETK
jgi:hypothetical protein